MLRFYQEITLKEYAIFDVHGHLISVNVRHVTVNLQKGQFVHVEINFQIEI